MVAREAIQDEVVSEEKKGCNRISSPTSPESQDIILPSLPPQIFQLFLPQNNDLKAEHWGVAFVIWVSQPAFPTKAARLRKALNMGRNYFWRILEDLEKHKIIKILSKRNSPNFIAKFLTCASPVQVEDFASKINLCLSSATKELASAPGVQVTPTCASQALGGGGGLYIPSTPTPSELETILGQEGLEALETLGDRLQAGHLIPHYRVSVELQPYTPGARLRGALFYRADMHQRRHDGRDPLALLMNDVKQGHSLRAPSDHSKKPPSNAKRVDLSAAAESKPIETDPALVSRDQILFCADIWAPTHETFSSLMDRLEALYSASPQWPAVKAQLETPAMLARLRFKKTKEPAHDKS